VDAVVDARKVDRHVIAMMGGHVIKCGLGSVLNYLLGKECFTHIAMNGAAAIHDIEIAYMGETSEDVEANLQNGTFGMWEETGKLMNDSLNNSTGRMGACLARVAAELDHGPYSVLAGTHKSGTPLTVHVALGTDIVHQHANADGARIGEATLADFRFLCKVVEQLDGGVVINFGSAVILPEVFLKALAVARNASGKPTAFTAANFDMVKHYRPVENILNRTGAKGYNFVGHHEIMIPLFAQAVAERLG
jgi:hypothetical protein